MVRSKFIYIFYVTSLFFFYIYNNESLILIKSILLFKERLEIAFIDVHNITDNYNFVGNV